MPVQSAAAWGRAPQPAAAQTFAPLGVFPGGIDSSTWAADYAAFQKSMGQGATSTDVYIDYLHPMSGWPGNASYFAECMKANAPTMIPIVSVGLTVFGDVYVAGVYNEANAVAEMSAVAAGTYDADYAGVINAFKAQGFQNIDLRIGWEQNGNWYGWAGTRDATTAAAYVAAFQHVADLAHNLVPAYPITGITVKTVWSPDEIGWTATPTIGTYPGDNYVDVVGPDLYSNVWPDDLEDWGTRGLDGTLTACALNPINREHYWDYPAANQWSPTSTGGWGMLADIAFAKAHGKPFGLSECGAGNNGSTHGPVDEAQFPYYLANRLSSAMEQGVPIEYTIIWDANVSGTWDFSDGTKPNEEAAWNQFVGTMAAAQMTAEPFGVDYAIGRASSTAGSGAGPYVLAGSGTGYIADSTADNFNFIALPQEGDGSFVMQLTSQSARTGQTGVMLRAGMRPGDAYAALYVSGTKCTFIARSAPGAPSVRFALAKALRAPWLKIERMGSTLTGSQSPDGKQWICVGSVTISTPTNAYIGAAISSGSFRDNLATVNDVNSPNDVIVENTAATTTGSWSTVKSAFSYSGTYYSDSNALTTPGTISYQPDLPQAGNYDIYAWYTPGSTNGGTPSRANNVPITVSNLKGSSSLVLDETTGLVSHWNYVGTAPMVAGAGNTITLANAGTTSIVVADALMFVRSPTPPPSLRLPWSTFRPPWSIKPISAARTLQPLPHETVRR